MVQSYTSDCFAASNVAQTDLQNMENNFNTLRSNFSGTAQPSNPVAGGHWMDTTGGTLKVRNSSNAAWSTVFDVDNERALRLNRQVIAGTGLSGGGTLTSDVTVSHGPHSGDVSGTTALTISNNIIGGKQLNRNAVVYVSHSSEDSNYGGFADTHAPTPLVVPSKKGFLRIIGNGKRAGTWWDLRLRVGNQYSSGTGQQTNLNYTTDYHDGGSVSLSTFVAGDIVTVCPQINGNTNGFARRIVILWGSST